MRKPELPNLFNRYQESLNIFTKKFYDDLSDPLYFTHKYFLGWVDQNGNPSESSGKAFRPSIMMLINESLEGSDKNILPIAMSGSPLTALAIDAANSGRLVPIAIIVSPIITLDTPR